MKNKFKVGRLAMRIEGNLWNAYYAKENTLIDAIYLGGINFNIVQNPVNKELFLSLMRDAVADIIEEGTGIRPQWGEEEDAPLHEKTGNA